MSAAAPEPGVGEPAAVIERYARRDAHDARYSLLRPEVHLETQARQTAVIELLARKSRRDSAWPPLEALRAVEVGCGNGNNLLDLLRLGCAAAHLTGLDLLPPALEQARERLPPGLRLVEGDASVAPMPAASQDLVLAYTVFSSLLDDVFQQQLADAMWRWLKPGGAVLIYDFTWNNPRNPDVRAVPAARLKALFPQGRLQLRRLTLAPPLARRLARWHPALPRWVNLVVPLRTHLLAWIEKPR